MMPPAQKPMVFTWPEPVMSRMASMAWSAQAA
jgi:hypothetical protein